MSEESTFSFGKPLMAVLLLTGGLGGGYYWWTHKPVVYTDAEGYSIPFPTGWEAKPGDREMTALGPVTEGAGFASATTYINTGAELRRQLSVYGPEVYQEITIDGKPAALGIYTEGASRFVEIVLQAGDKCLRFRMACPVDVFEKNREILEKCARGITWPR